jgi:hypothetical protein
MNKNKLSRFLLSTSVGIIATLGISEVTALSTAEEAVWQQARAQQGAEIQAHRAAAIAHFKGADATMTDAKALELANELVLRPSGLSALNTLGDGNTTQLFEHFKDVLIGGVDLTAEHFDDFLARIADASTLQALGVADVTQLKSPEAERLVVPSQITTVKDAVYFAEQRKDAGEFEAAATFFLKARDLIAATNQTTAKEYAEKALMMYSEHFIHAVARVSSVSAEKIAAAQALLLTVKALAEDTNTPTAFVRAASCAEELATAIHDLVLLEKAAKAKLEAAAVVDAAAVTAASVKIAKLYVDVYNADVVSRDMHGKAAGLYTSSDKNTQLAAAADAMRLAVGALADAHIAKADAVFAGDTTVVVKLKEDALAFNDMYTDLADTVGVANEKLLKTYAASAQVLNAKLKATWNARSRFAVDTEEYNALNTQYLAIRDSIVTLLGNANAVYAPMATGGEHYLGARDIATVRLVNAERLHRDVLDKVAVDPMVHADVSAAVTALSTYVADNGSLIVVNGLDNALKETLDEAKADLIRSARTDAHKTVASERALVAKARALELEKIAEADAALAVRATRLEAYLTLARQANNKAAWEAGVTAADVVLAHADVAAAAGDEARLVKALALTVKAEALLKRNTAANDTLVAAVDADNVLDAGILFDADALATAIDNANRALRIRARKELRQAFESAVELHNAATVKQGLRTAWATLENAYATDEVTVADAALTANVRNGDATFVSEALAILSDANNDTVAGLKGALGALTTLSTVVGNGAGTVINAGNYLHVTVGGVRYVTKAVADVTAGGGVLNFDFEASAGAPAGGATAFRITLAAGVADLDALRLALAKCADGAGEAGTLAEHYAALHGAPAVAIDGVSLDSLDTHAKLYNHLVSKFSSLRAASATYKGYETAAKAWEKARQAKSEWAENEVKNLSAATAATFAAKRNAAGAAYIDAANFETSRLRALFANAGRGLWADAAFDTLDEVAGVMAANNGRLAGFYVSEEALTSLHRRAVSLEASAMAYNKTRAAIGADAAIAVNDVARDASIALAVRGDDVGAFEVATGLVNSVFLGLANVNDAADFGALVAERLAAFSPVYSKVTSAWLSNLTSTLALDDVNAPAHRAAVQALLQDGAAVNAGVDLAGRVFSLSERFVDAGNYPQTHAVRRNLTLSYETVLRSLVSLVVAEELDAHQGHVYTAMVAEATRARNLALTAYVPGADVTEAQMNEVLANLEERAAMAEAIRLAVYGATRTNTPSNTTASFKAARAQAIDAAATLIPEGAQDTADIVLRETNVVATVNLKAKVAHELARAWVAKGGAEAMRYSNSGLSVHKESALDAFSKGLAAYNQEVDLILSTTTAGDIPTRNTRLLAAYEAISAACAEMVKVGVTTADTVKKQHTATFKQAQILYREGHKDRALALLEGLESTDAAKVVHGPILNELAAEYEAEGKFLKAAKAFESSTLNHVAKKEAKEAFSAAERALSAAKQSGHLEAAQAAANAFNAIGGALFHGRVRAEAYHKAAEAYVFGELYEDAATAYANSAARWGAIGDHMQAGNQFEKAAWALSKVTDISVDQRIALIQYIEKAAHQLQIVDATQRLEKLVTLAEEQIAKIESDENIASGKLKTAVIAAAGALYEKALAFQKEGNLSHAESAEARILALLKKVDANGKEAGILAHVGNLYVLQKKHADAINTFIKAAESYVEGVQLAAAADMYAKAAKAGLAGGQGARIKDEILPKLLEISASVRTGGDNAGRDDQFEIHMAILDVYQDLMVSHPGEVDSAFAELTEIEKETITDPAVKAQLAAVKIALLSQKARTTSGAEAKAALLANAQSAFDAVKALTGNSQVAIVKVKNFITLAAQQLAEMYMYSKVIHSAVDGLVQMAAFKTVVDAADSAALASYTAASTAKDGYDVALEASKRAAKTMEIYTRAMLHYMTTEADKARADDMNALRAMPDRMVAIAGNAVRATLLGILKSREEAKGMQEDFVAVMNFVNEVNTYVAAMRAQPAVRDAHGDATAAPALKTAATAAPETMKAVVADLGEHAADAHKILDPVARATTTDALVAAKTDAVAAAVVSGLQAHADLTKKAPAAEVSKTALADTAAAITTVIVGDGKTKGLLGDLQHAQTGPSTATQAVIVK